MANAPTAMAITAGFLAGSQNTVDPHCGQKWNMTMDPLSPARLKLRCSPLVSTAAREKKAATPNALPVRRWHALQ